MSDIIQVICAVLDIILTISIFVFSRRLEKQADKHSEEDARKARERLTIEAFRDLYKDTIIPFENMGFPKDIKKALSYGDGDDSSFSSKKEMKMSAVYKDYKHLVSQIEMFALSLDKEYYDREIFNALMPKDVETTLKPRLVAFFEAVYSNGGNNPYEHTLKLINNFSSNEEDAEG